MAYTGGKMIFQNEIFKTGERLFYGKSLMENIDAIFPIADHPFETLELACNDFESSNGAMVHGFFHILKIPQGGIRVKHIFPQALTRHTIRKFRTARLSGNYGKARSTRGHAHRTAESNFPNFTWKKRNGR